jgi:hypothetical protein
MEGRTGRTYRPCEGSLLNSLERMRESFSGVGQPVNLRWWRKTGERERATGGRMASIRLRVIWTRETDGAVHFASMTLTRTAVGGQIISWERGLVTHRG